MRHALLKLTALCATLLAPLALHAPPVQAAPAVATTPANARVIVKFKTDSALVRRQALSAANPAAQRTGQAEALGQRLGLTLSAGAGVSDRSHVVFASGISSAQLAQRLSADAEVEYAVPDERRHAMVAPNDVYYPALAGTIPAVGQWYLRAPSGVVKASINVEPAWDITWGLPSVVVAVLDSGVLFNHPDLKTVANGGKLLAGYDMISDAATANDGNGRDIDPSDPGDWVTSAEAASGVFAQCEVTDSSWHGTATSAVVGALTNNGEGMASVGRNVRVLPVRVLGKCGGFDSDIIAGMRWAAGLSTGDSITAPVNPNPAQVVNLSLGGVGACTAAYINAVQDLTALGVTVVASAGNGTGHAVASPANCPGVIAVSGLRHVGSKVGYADIGPEVAISAPGGNCVNATGECLYPILTASNTGFNGPLTNDYYTETGTSFSAPLVSGTVALMISANTTQGFAALTPLQIKLALQGTARAFPTTGATSADGNLVRECTAPQYTSTGAPIDQEQCYCSTGTCGAGMLDAGAAVKNINDGFVVFGNGVQARIDANSRNTQVGSVLALSGLNSAVQSDDQITQYLWTLVDGGGNVVTQIVNPSSANASVTPRAPGRFVVSLKVTTRAGRTSTAQLTLVAGSGAALDSGSGGGGGALGAVWLALLSLAVLALRGAARRVG
jgi:serine protease